MGLLNQVIAVVTDKKKTALESLTAAYHKIQKPELFAGISKTYRPRDEDGDRLPSEQNRVQVKVRELISEVRKPLIDMYDTVATQDAANCNAIGNIVVDDNIILEDIPVTTLLFLEKQVNDIKTFVSKLPTLDPSEKWDYDSNADCYATEPAETTRSKKISKPVVLYEATDKHPAQVQVQSEDILAGYWKTIKFSGAIPAKEKNAMLDRVRQLHEAIVKAREQANSMTVTEVRIGQEVLDFVFED